jgi:polyhydroxybutyrate depolymerase
MRGRRSTVALVVAVTAAVLLLAGACSRTSAGDRQEAKAKANAATSTAPPTSTSVAPATCAPGRPADAGTTTSTIPFGGIDRTYLVHVPTGYTGTTPVPVVFDFHGHGSSAAVQLVYSGLVPVADREGFLLVAPQGQGDVPHFTLLGATPTEADDVDLTLAILDRLEAERCVDTTRVYATGMSNGGALSSVLACRAADRFAATASVAAFIYLPACDDVRRAVPFEAFMGTGDPIVPFAGGRVNCCGNPTIPGAEDTMASFAKHARCADPPATERLGTTVERRHWTGCAPGAAVELYVIEGGGHTWPGSPIDVSSRGLGATTHDVDATETIWAFFAAHRLPSS